MEKEIRDKLIEIARFKSTLTYTQLNQQLDLRLDFNMGYDRGLIGEWLGNISRHEFENGRPLLSAIVTQSGKKREQGDGFYKLCEDWEVLKADKEWENEMIADCYTFWLNPDNFKKHKNDY